MPLLDTLDRKFGRFAIPNLTIYIIAGQIVFYLLISLRLVDFALISFIPQKVLEGQFWRIFTFIFIPPALNPIFLFFELYIFYLMGTALEDYWGTFRYDLFIFIGAIATIASSFFMPSLPATNVFVIMSVFLAFAFLYPDFELYIFFILPLKVKWLALIVWLGYFIQLAFGNWEARLMIIASVSNFLFFFGKEIFLRARSAKWRMKAEATHFAKENQPFHKCGVCGITDKSSPDMQFRYCTDCEPASEYCSKHIDDHKHVREK